MFEVIVYYGLFDSYISLVGCIESIVGVVVGKKGVFDKEVVIIDCFVVGVVLFVCVGKIDDR